MEIKNTPPFYVGQPVVAIATGVSTNRLGEVAVRIKKGQQFNVTAVFNTCCGWCITVGILIPQVDTLICGRCGTPVSFDTHGEIHASAKLFAPITPKFETITYQKVVEQEAPLIGKN
jgi:hypothetical protein